MMDEMSFDAYHEWLGIPPSDQPPNHYRLLGLQDFESNDKAIENAADRLMSYLRSFQTGSRADVVGPLLNEVSAARLTLLDPSSKKGYDYQLRERLSGGGGASEPPARRVVDPPVQPVTRHRAQKRRRFSARRSRAKSRGSNLSERELIRRIIAVCALAVMLSMLALLAVWFIQKRTSRDAMRRKPVSTLSTESGYHVLRFAENRTNCSSQSVPR